MLCKSTLSALVVSFTLVTAPAVFAQSPPKAVDAQSVAGAAAPNDALPNPAATPLPTKTLHLTFALASVRRADLDALIKTQQDPKSPNFHHWLTPQQIGQRFGAADADLKAVVSYAQSQGFKVTNVWPNHLFVSADATVAQAERAFNVHIGGYDRPANMTRQGDPPTFYAPDHDPQAPASISSRLNGIFGMSNLLRMHHNTQGSSSASSGFQPLHPSSPVVQPMTSYLGYGPSQVSALYDLDGLHTAGLNGDSMAIGIYSPTLVDFSDVAYFAASYGISGYAIYQEIIDGGPTDASGAMEANLDMDMILGQANHATIYMYEPPNGDTTFDDWLQMESDDLPVISDSWGYSETDLVGYPSFVSAFDSILATMEAQGQALYNASGDNGAYNHAHTALSVTFPASSTHVTGVGGTSFPGQYAWVDEEGWSGSGGGLSVLFSSPSWQVGPGVANAYSNGMRQVPDIAALADPNTPGYWVYSGGQWLLVGGTSASTPLWASANLLIDQGAGARFGNLNPALYWIGTNLNDATDIMVYHDSTTGNNGYYSCTPDWDFVTGWGSANFYKLYVDLLMEYDPTVHSALLPDLLPFNPGSGAPGGNWTSPIMIHSTYGNVTEPTAFNDTTSYYIAIAVLDNGPADAPMNAQSVRIDGVDNLITLGPFPSEYYWYSLEPLSTTLSAGTHTLSLIADVNNTVPESNESNNVFTRTISVNPSVSALTLNPTSVTGGGSSTGTVNLTAPAPTGGVVVTLSSSNTAVATVPANVTVAAGTSSATFTVTTLPTTLNKSVTISASESGTSQSATLSVNAFTITALKLVPSSVYGPASAKGTVTFNTAAPAGNLSLTLSSSSAAAAVPASVAIPAGQTTVSFPITTSIVAANTSSTITAALSDGSKAAKLTIKAAQLSKLAFSPTSVKGGSNTTLKVTLTSPAPASGATVSLTSSNAAVVPVPATIVVPAGASSASVTITTGSDSANTVVSVTGVYSGVSKKASITVTP